MKYSCGINHISCKIGVQPWVSRFVQKDKIHPNHRVNSKSNYLRSISDKAKHIGDRFVDSTFTQGSRETIARELFEV